MLKYLLLHVYLFGLFVGCNQQNVPRSVLAIFAHPDDEIYVAPILSRYVREGAEVNLVIVTDGRFGPGSSGLEGEELIALRKEELNCSAQNLGINPPFTLGYHDQLKINEGLGPHVHHARDLVKELDSLINEINPDVLITWGPDGGTNHPDHRLVGVSVSHVFMSRERDTRLFYVGTPSDQLPEEDQLLHGVDRSYLNTRISYDSIDFHRTTSALKCYTSQWTSEQMDSRVTKMRSNKKIIFLREFQCSREVKNDLFD